MRPKSTYEWHTNTLGRAASSAHIPARTRRRHHTYGNEREYYTHTVSYGMEVVVARVRAVLPHML